MLTKFNAKIKDFHEDQRGLGTLEILLIVAVLVVVAIIFRKYIISWVDGLFGDIDGEINDKGGKGDMTNPGPGN
ncbi:Flp1 family type IVb pilin [Longirhabdus pacifica]|uniref:Flp1 family type IVb pilin n=1 Tax=Longirhabdus pacifica TaxID=2305227 RepID=UPI0010087233|nr:Flp1 family type IVb pilin [Longirhabdus pacifica]